MKLLLSHLEIKYPHAFSRNTHRKPQTKSLPFFFIFPICSSSMNLSLKFCLVSNFLCCIPEEKITLLILAEYKDTTSMISNSQKISFYTKHRRELHKPSLVANQEAVLYFFLSKILATFQPSSITVWVKIKLVSQKWKEIFLKSF